MTEKKKRSSIADPGYDQTYLRSAMKEIVDSIKQGIQPSGLTTDQTNGLPTSVGAHMFNRVGIRIDSWSAGQEDISVYRPRRCATCGKPVRLGTPVVQLEWLSKWSTGVVTRAYHLPHCFSRGLEDLLTPHRNAMYFLTQLANVAHQKLDGFIPE